VSAFIPLLLLVAPAWPLPEWGFRAVVEVPAPTDGGDAETAVARVLCQGRAQPDGDDYRVLDSSGAAVPFEVLFHDAARYGLIAFRAAPSAGTYYVYFGNPAAERAVEQVAAPSAPGSGPPAVDASREETWSPRIGMTYTTRARPEGDNPLTIEEFAALLAASPAAYGARVQPRVADGHNPFGPSDNYLSVYRGWIDIPADGEYRFCTASNEASFSLLDGKELIHWPGRHTAERGERGEKNATVALTAGLHYLEYYHEEVVLQQMAFLGWSPPGASMGLFAALPEELFPAPRAGQVARYEARDAAPPPLAFEPTIVDSLWPAARHTGQWTRVTCRLAHAGQFPNAEETRWDFGDGQSAVGAEVEHVYLTLGQFAVTAALAGESAAWPLEIYEVQHVTAEIGGGNAADYAAHAKGYDPETLDAAALAELAHLLAEGGDDVAAAAAGRRFLERFPDAEPKQTALLRRLLAECALRRGDEGLDEAIANYRQSIAADTPATEKLDVLGRLIHLLGVNRGDVERAAEVFGEVETIAANQRLDEEGQAAFRRATIAAGDAHLWSGDADSAADLYRRAEALGPKTPSQVRAARIGAYPNAIRELLAAGDAGAALDLVREWEESFPGEKLRGQTFFWRGKLSLIGGRGDEAAGQLARAVERGQGAAFESEARWLLAQALRAQGREEESREELSKLIASGLNDEFVVRAKKLLAP